MKKHYRNPELDVVKFRYNNNTIDTSYGTEIEQKGINDEIIEGEKPYIPTT